MYQDEVVADTFDAVLHGDSSSGAEAFAELMEMTADDSASKYAAQAAIAEFALLRPDLVPPSTSVRAGMVAIALRNIC